MEVVGTSQPRSSRSRSPKSNDHAIQHELPSLDTLVKDISKGRLQLIHSASPRAVAACTDIAAGEVLFIEKPLVTTCSNDPESLKALGGHILGDRHLQRMVEELHDGGTFSNCLLDSGEQIALQAGTASEQEWMRRWFRIFQTNAFTYTPRDEDGYALFSAGCMINHSCKPNAVYHTTADSDYATYRAINSIVSGDEITHSYINHFDIITTEQRRKQLKVEYNFDCRCEACSAPDATRSMTCLAEACKGMVMPKLLKGADVLQWQCALCSTAYTDDELPLQAEAWLTQLVLDHDQNFHAYEREHFVATLHLAAEMLSPKHWTVDFMVSLLLEGAIGMHQKAGFPAKIVSLSRFRLVWAREAAPSFKTKLLENKFHQQMMLSMHVLQQADQQVQAVAHIAAEIVDDHRSMFGLEDHPELLEYASTGRKGSLIHGFDWNNWRVELGDLSIGQADANRVEPLIDSLRMRMRQGDNPRRSISDLRGAECVVQFCLS